MQKNPSASSMPARSTLFFREFPLVVLKPAPIQTEKEVAWLGLMRLTSWRSQAFLSSEVIHHAPI